MMYEYEKNVDRINKFFKKSERYEKELLPLAKEGQFGYLVNTILKEEIDGDKIYKDPDGCDKELYSKMAKEYGFEDSKKFTLLDNNITLSIDCVSGWRPILRYYLAEYMDDKITKEELEENFIEAYRTVRNPQNAGHLIWPKADKEHSINWNRSLMFSDRVDATLLDMKFYIEGKKDKVRLIECFSDLRNIEWFKQFNTFEDFVKRMKLERWCVKKDNGEYDLNKVRDLCGDEFTELKGHKDKYTKYCRFMINEKTRKEYSTYLSNLLEVIKQ